MQQSHSDYLHCVHFDDALKTRTTNTRLLWTISTLGAGTATERTRCRVSAPSRLLELRSSSPSRGDQKTGGAIGGTSEFVAFDSVAVMSNFRASSLLDFRMQSKSIARVFLFVHLQLRHTTSCSVVVWGCVAPGTRIQRCGLVTPTSMILCNSLLHNDWLTMQAVTLYTSVKLRWFDGNSPPPKWFHREGSVVLHNEVFTM